MPQKWPSVPRVQIEDTDEIAFLREENARLQEELGYFQEGATLEEASVQHLRKKLTEAQEEIRRLKAGLPTDDPRAKMAAAEPQPPEEEEEGWFSWLSCSRERAR